MTRLLTACFLAALSMQLTGQEEGLLLLDSVTGFHMDTSEIWRKDYREIYSYNVYGKLIEEVSYAWDDGLEQWVGTGSGCFYGSCMSGWILYSYDARGNLIGREGYSWQYEVYDWVLDFREELTYDGAGHQSSYAWERYYYEYVLPVMIQVWAYGYENHFDENGNVIEYISYERDGEGGERIFQSRDLNSYDAAGHLTEQITQYWNDMNSSWINEYRRTYTYDTGGNETSSTSYQWDRYTGDWKGEWRNLIDYNTDGAITELIYQFWKDELESWINDSRESYAYDSLGNEIENTSYRWNPANAEWEFCCWRVVQVYDENGRLAERWAYTWDDDDTAWIAEDHEVYSYGPYGYESEYIHYSRDDELQALRESRRREYVHDAEGHELEVARYYWDVISGTWHGDSRYVQAFDSLGNRTDWFSYYWNNNELDWEADQWESYSWDSLGNRLELTYWIWDDSENDWVGRPLSWDQGSCNNGRQVQEYDSLGNVTAFTAYDWDEDSLQWAEMYKKDYYRQTLGPHEVLIPDTAFRHALIEQGVDASGDSLISFDEARDITRLNVSGRGTIQDLAGIEAFINLDTLLCQGNQLQRLVLIYNDKLVCLDCSGNELEELRVPENTALLFLDCSGNRLTWPDLPDEAGLLTLDCSNNLIQEMDLSHQSALTWLNGSHNQLTALNLLQTTALNYLSLGGMPSLREVCVGSLPFPPAGLEVDTAGSPNAYFTNECELDGDWLEDNDWQSASVILQEGTEYDNLYVTRADDDWFELRISEGYTRTPMTITCLKQDREDPIRMELLDEEGKVIGTAWGVNDRESIALFPVQPASFFLRISIDGGDYGAYRLQWTSGEFSADTEIRICDPGGSCKLLELPVAEHGALLLDTLEIDLYSGDGMDQVIGIENLGSDLYFFYPALESPEPYRSMNPCITLNGDGSYVRVKRDESMKISDAVTLEAWIKNGVDALILSQGYNGEGYSLFTTADGRLGFWTASTLLLSKTILDGNRWNHVAASYDGETLRLYVNGIPDTTYYAPGEISDTKLDLYMGGLHPLYGPSPPFNGSLDEVRIWNIARKPREIRSYMNRGLTGSEPGLIGYWPANMESIYVLKDLVYGNHGMLIGGVQWDETALTVVNYVDWSEDIGFIAPGRTDEFIVQVRAMDTKGGTYIASLQLISGVPSTVDALLPIKLHVTEAPSFSIKPDSIGLGEIELYRTEQVMIEVSNTGTMSLRIDSIRTDLEGTRITPDQGILQPGEAAMFKAEFFMRFPGAYDGGFTFFTNDPSNRTIRVPYSGSALNMNPAYVQLGSITDQVYIGYWKQYGKSFPNPGGSEDVILVPSIVTYSLTGDSHDLIPRADSTPGTWITTTLPEVCLLDPMEDKRFDVILDATGLTPGPYFADLILEWFDPVLHHGIMPVRMQAVPEPQPGVTPAAKPDFLIYPNPTRDRAIIRLGSQGEYTLQLLTANGLLLKELRITGDHHTLDLDSEAPGLYFIRILCPDFVETAKVIRLR